jgi:hypothetical protein
MTQGADWLPVPDQTPPLLFGPAEVTEGYYELEALERNYVLQAMQAHRQETALWYRALTLYQRGMLGTWVYEGDDTKISRTVWGLQGQLLGLGVSSAKAGLDTLLAGYYSVTYGSIRHMLESYIQFLYVAVCPEDAKKWYRQPGGPDAQAEPPGFGSMAKDIKAHPLWTAEDLIDKVGASWKLMCKGAHPSGEGISQTTAEEDGFVFGATYKKDMALAGFDHGFYALTMLLSGLSALRIQGETWTQQFESWHRDVDAWRKQVGDAMEHPLDEEPTSDEQ